MQESIIIEEPIKRIYKPYKIEDTEIRKTISVKLTDDQSKEKDIVGADRHFAKADSFRNKNRFITQDDLDEDIAHKIGLIGEIGWFIFSGEQWDRNIYKVRDSGLDFMKGGINLKTITYMGPDPELKIEEIEFDEIIRGDKPTPNKFVLARWDKNNPSIVEFVGQIYWNDFLKHKTKKMYKGKNHYNWIAEKEHLQTVTAD